MDRYDPFTPEWAAELHRVIREEPAFAVAARDWRWPIELVLEPSPTVGIDRRRAIRLYIEGGACQRIAVDDGQAASEAFVFTGCYAVWKQIVRAQVHPVAAVMRGQLSLKGSLTTFARHLPMADALIACAQRVPTRFPDEESATPA